MTPVPDKTPGAREVLGMAWALAAGWAGTYSRTSWPLSLPASLSQVQHVMGGLVIVSCQGLLHAPEAVTLSPKLRAQILLDKLKQISPIYQYLKRWSQNKTLEGQVHYPCDLGVKQIPGFSRRHGEVCKKTAEAAKGMRLERSAMPAPHWERLAATSASPSLK